MSYRKIELYFFSFLPLVILIAFAWFSLNFLPSYLSSIANSLAGSKEVDYIEVKELYDNEESIYFKTTKEKRFLSEVFGDTTINEVYITDEDGVTERIPLDKIYFEVGDNWRIKKSGVQQRRKDGSIDYVYIDTYTIIGTKDELINLSSDFTKTFRMEFNVEQ